jgi:carbonic anhydrase
MPTPSPAVVESGAVRATSEFTSTIPFADDEPDCLVISCSDHRFREQVRELLAALGLKRPHLIAVPGGVLLSSPLLSAVPYLSKTLDHLIERIVDAKALQEIVCIGHQGCGVYKAGKHKLLDLAVQRLVGRSTTELHIEHLSKAARRLRQTLPRVRVRAYLAEIVEQGSERSVRFRQTET